MKTKLSGKFWLALTLFSLIGQVAWVVENMYLNVFIYKMFNATAADISNMVAASAVAATLTTLLIGALSDKIGKRKLFICGGYILWGISIFSFIFLKTEIISSVFPMVTSAAALGASLTIIFDCIMTFFGSSANDAAFNAWLTDSTDSTNRGAAEGINSMMPLIATIAVFGGFMFLDLDKSDSWTIIFAVIGIIVLLVGILGIFIIKDTNVKPSETGYFKNVVYGFLPSVIKENSRLYITLIASMIFTVSVQIFMPYLILYYEVSLGMENYVLIMAPAVIIAAVVTFLWGKVYDKKGFNFTYIFSFLWLVIGYLLLFFFKSGALVLIGSLFMMSGFLSSGAVFGAKIRDLTPEGKAGRFQGVRIFSQVMIPGIVGPYIGKTVLRNAETITNNDGTTSFVPNENIFLASFVVLLVLAVVLLVTKEKNKNRLCDLKTPFEEKSETSWETEHPAPQFKRDTYFTLNGQWDLSVDSKKSVERLGEITVPYPPESRISGINRRIKKGEKYIYERSFSIPEEYKNKNIILHFGAVDCISEIYINEKFAHKNVGGYLPFKVDITDCIADGENTVKVIVTDDLDYDYPCGKQSDNRGGMWYTPISGIWQSVWVEAVPEKHIESIKITPTTEYVTIETVGGEAEKTIILDGTNYNFTGDKITIKIENPVNWTPENPHLYYFTLICGEDKIESYFALRTITLEEKNSKTYICLNGKPYFFHGLLDQGYYSDGIYTPASPDGYLYDIKTMKELGFNMLRKHIKTEPDIFYYYCDKYGMAVFQDMVNNGKYDFILHGVLPTMKIRKGLYKKASAFRQEQFETTAENLIKELYNHPSVCYYTIFNEGWGQYDKADELYERFRNLDPSRIYDTASGWFKTKKSDVTSEHIYFNKIRMKSEKFKALVLSEFGGYSYKVEGHSFNLDSTYAYRFYNAGDKFNKAMKELYMNEVIPMIDEGLCATVLTQVSDVEDETNGLLTYDRQIIKVDEKDMQEIAGKIKEKFEVSTR